MDSGFWGTSSSSWPWWLVLCILFFCLFITLFGFGRTLNLVARNFKRRHGHAVRLTRVLHQRDGRAPHYINVVGACGGRAPMFEMLNILCNFCGGHQCICAKIKCGVPQKIF